MVSSGRSAVQDKSAKANQDTAAVKFVSAYEADVRPLEIAMNLAWWKANTSGKDEDFAAKVEAQNRLDQALADRERFAALKAIHAGKISDETLARQIDVLYRIYLEKQVDPELLKRITVEGQRDRKGLQRLSGEARRPRDRRQRSPKDPEGVEGQSASARPSGNRARAWARSSRTI